MTGIPRLENERKRLEIEIGKFEEGEREADQKKRDRASGNLQGKQLGFGFPAERWE